MLFDVCYHFGSYSLNDVAVLYTSGKECGRQNSELDGFPIIIGDSFGRRGVEKDVAIFAQRSMLGHGVSYCQRTFRSSCAIGQIQPKEMLEYSVARLVGILVLRQLAV